MLSKGTVLASNPLASLIASKGLVVAPKSNSVLSELVQATNALDLDKGIYLDDVFNPAVYGEFIERQTFNMAQPTQHDTIIQHYTDDLKKAVVSHVRFTKNIIKPVVVDFAEKLRAYLSNRTTDDAESSFTIQVLEYPEPLKDLIFTNAVEKAGDKVASLPKSNLPVVNDWTAESLLGFIQTGNKDIDKDIITWFSRANDKDALVFIANNAREDMVANTSDVDTILLVYLLAGAAYDKDAYSDALPLAASRDIASGYRDWAAKQLIGYISRMAMITKAGIVVSSPGTSTNKTIVVIGDTYRLWLSQGGSIEVLLGMAVSSTNYTKISQLEANKEALLKEWHGYKLYYQNSQANQKLSAARIGVDQVFREVMSSLTEEEDAYGREHSGHLTSVNERLKRIVENMRLSDLNDIYSFALKTVCRARFYYTDAECILAEIEEVGKNNPNASPAECALIATVHYLTDYMCDQLYLSNAA